MSVGGEKKWADWIIIALGVVTAVAQIALLCRGEDFIVGKLTNDDTFYYLQTVWNTKQLGWVTFDGLHSTNGVQLLWFWMLWAVSWLAASKGSFLIVSLALTMALNVACLLPIRTLGLRLGSPRLAVVMAALWTVQLFWGVYWLGLENSIHALVVWCVAAEIARLFALSRVGAPWSLWRLGLLLLLNVWTRMDGVVMGAGIFAFTVFVLARDAKWDSAELKRIGEQIVRLLPAAAIAGIGYAGACYAMGGSVLPVSAIVKTGSPVSSPGLLDDLLLKIGCDFPPLLPFRFQSGPVAAAVAAAGLAAMFLLGRVSRATFARTAIRAACALGCGLLAYHAVVIVLHAQYAPYCNWHRSPMFIFWIVVLSLAITLAWEIVAKNQRVDAVFTCALLLATAGMCTHRFVQTVNFPFEKHTWHQRYRLAKWVDANLPKDAILGAWNAGEMGYFSGRRVINLDGLINHVSYGRSVVLGGASLVDYLRENKVGYLVDYFDGIHVKNDLVVEKLPVIHTLDRGGGYPLTVWRFDPDSKL